MGLEFLEFMEKISRKIWLGKFKKFRILFMKTWRKAVKAAKKSPKKQFAA